MKKLTIDVAHSEVGFKIKHLMISPVRGTFGEFSGEITGEDSNLEVNFELSTSSINTNNSDRDGHLRSPEFFDCENFPKITFKSTGSKLESGKLTGDITIKGITKSITLDVEYGGIGVDPWGNTKHGFEITGTLNRSDFGLVWNSPLAAGGFLLAEEVKLNLDVQVLEVVPELESVN